MWSGEDVKHNDCYFLHWSSRTLPWSSNSRVIHVSSQQHEMPARAVHNIQMRILHGFGGNLWQMFIVLLHAWFTCSLRVVHIAFDTNNSKSCYRISHHLGWDVGQTQRAFRTPQRDHTTLHPPPASANHHLEPCCSCSMIQSLQCLACVVTSGSTADTGFCPLAALACPPAPIGSSPSIRLPPTPVQDLSSPSPFAELRKLGSQVTVVVATADVATAVQATVIAAEMKVWHSPTLLLSSSRSVS